jgi:hypothetical protein
VASLYTNSSGNGNIAIGPSAGYYETGSNKLFIDNTTRASEADGRVKSLIYGVFASTPSSQVLVVNGQLGLNITPTSWVTLPAGSSGAGLSPIKFTSGTSMSTPEVGAMEFTTDDLYFTITTGAARKGIVLNDGSNLTSSRVPFATTDGRLHDSANLSFDGTTLTTTDMTVSGTTLVSGSIGVGTTSPNSLVDVYNGGGGTLRLSSNNSASYGELIFSSNNGSYLAYGASIEGDGGGYGVNIGQLLFKVGIGTVRTEAMRLNYNGRLGIGVTAPTANLHLKAGTAAASTAPLKIPSGPLLTTPEAGAIESDGTHLYWTDDSGTRHTIV